MKRLAFRVWTAHREKILYLVVGAWNTLVQYAVFSVCWFLLHQHLHPDLVLLVAYLIASVNGFLGFRYIVFRSRGHVFIEYLKFQVVYLPLLMVNMVVLPVLLAYTPLNAYVVQALFAAFAVVAGYLGNRYFAFHKPRAASTRID